MQGLQSHWAILQILALYFVIFEMKEPASDRVVGKRLWNKDEDELLSAIVFRYPEQKWATISVEFNRAITSREPTVKRTNKQCRERWQNHLNPILRNNAEWSQAQHEMLFTLFREYSHQWCQISTKLQESGFARRGDNHIKNYFYSSIKRAIKRINETVRENNKQIKKQKSILYNYNEKYAYKKRLSLQRQILNTSLINNDSTSHENHHQLKEPRDIATHQMRIIKELDQDIVSKVLLIAEQKGGKKFTISNKAYEEEAISTRNRLIDFIQNNANFKAEDVIRMATEILQLSRKCKRKNCKTNGVEDNWMSEEVDQHELSPARPLSPPSKEDDQPAKAASAQEKGIDKPKAATSRANDEKNLLERFLCDEDDRRFGETHKKLSSEYSCSNKLVEQPPNSFSGFFHSNQQLPKICLDQSNSYIYGSNCYSQKGNLPFTFDLINFPLGFEQRPNPYNSLAYDVFDSQNIRAFPSPFDLFKSDNGKGDKPKENQEDTHTNLAEFNFINTMKQVEPKQSFINNSQMFDFDLSPNGSNFNPFIHGMIRKESQQDRLFCSQLAKPSSHRSNKSQSRIDKGELNAQGQQLEGQGYFQQGLNRSWAYSSSRLEQCRSLFNSNNYESSKRNDFSMHQHNSNFYPFGNKQQ